MEDTFLKIDDSILSLTSYTDDKGTTHEMSILLRVLHTYLLKRFNFFKAQGKQYFDTNKAISFALGIKENTISRNILTLTEIGLVDKKIIQYRNLPKNIFTNVKPLIQNSVKHINKGEPHSTFVQKPNEFPIEDFDPFSYNFEDNPF